MVPFMVPSGSEETVETVALWHSPESSSVTFTIYHKTKMFVFSTCDKTQGEMLKIKDFL